MNESSITDSSSHTPDGVLANESGQPLAARRTTATKLLLVRAGETDYDQQRRIKGRINIPVSEVGSTQIAEAAKATANLAIDVVYCAPCQASKQTATKIAEASGAKVRSMAELQNLDQGLWEGKLVDDIKSQQPKVYKRWQESPETVCPPQGEMLEHARDRLALVVNKALKKRKSGTIAFVMPEPLATVFSCYVQRKQLGDLWQCEKNAGQWELMDYAITENGIDVDNQHDDPQ